MKNTLKVNNELIFLDSALWIWSENAVQCYNRYVYVLFVSINNTKRIIVYDKKIHTRAINFYKL